MAEAGVGAVRFVSKKQHFLWEIIMIRKPLPHMSSHSPTEAGGGDSILVCILWVTKQGQVTEGLLPGSQVAELEPK